jgi:hypothetical protein
MSKSTQLRNDFQVVFEQALLETTISGVEAAEEVVYDANLDGYLTDPEALYILNRLNGYI